MSSTASDKNIIANCYECKRLFDYTTSRGSFHPVYICILCNPCFIERYCKCKICGDETEEEEDLSVVCLTCKTVTTEYGDVRNIK